MTIVDFVVVFVLMCVVLAAIVSVFSIPILHLLGVKVVGSKAKKSTQQKDSVKSLVRVRKKDRVRICTIAKDSSLVKSEVSKSFIFDLIDSSAEVKLVEGQVADMGYSLMLAPTSRSQKEALVFVETSDKGVVVK